MKETTMRLVDKNTLMALKDETWERFVQDYIVTELSADLGHRLMDILKDEKEITVRLSDVRTEESVLDQGIEYRQMMDWNPLVRCKDCKYHDGLDGQCPVQSTGDPFYDYKPDDNWFCADGERRE